MRPYIMLAFSLLTACDMVPRNMNAGLHMLVGHDIHDAEHILGYPESSRVILDQTIYTWARHRLSNLDTPSDCKIEIATNVGGTITSFQWQGDHAGCDDFADRLNP